MIAPNRQGKRRRPCRHRTHHRPGRQEAVVARSAPQPVVARETGDDIVPVSRLNIVLEPGTDDGVGFVAPGLEHHTIVILEALQRLVWAIVTAVDAAQGVDIQMPEFARPGPGIGHYRVAGVVEVFGEHEIILERMLEADRMADLVQENVQFHRIAGVHENIGAKIDVIGARFGDSPRGVIGERDGIECFGVAEIHLAELNVALARFDLEELHTCDVGDEPHGFPGDLLFALAEALEGVDRPLAVAVIVQIGLRPAVEGIGHHHRGLAHPASAQGRAGEKRGVVPYCGHSSPQAEAFRCGVLPLCTSPKTYTTAPK